jgi:hypothetical protein
MRKRPPYSNTLEICFEGKGIPYGGPATIRPDGSANYGFKYVKGNEQMLLSIPELQKDPDLLELARKINAPESGLFSVGSVSGAVQDEHGWRDSGYMEFAINSRTRVQDATSYFPIFFHFSKLLKSCSFAIPFSYSWEIEPARFMVADTTGFTATVFLNSHYASTSETARQNWSDALGVLGFYLSQIPVESDDFIYPQ